MIDLIYLLCAVVLCVSVAVLTVCGVRVVLSMAPGKAPKRSVEEMLANMAVRVSALEDAPKADSGEADSDADKSIMEGFQNIISYGTTQARDAGGNG